jgi:hypothetical protein
VRIYVSMEGSDGNSGVKDRPFLTVGRAQAESRRVRGSSAEPVEVLVQRGTYYLSEPLVFGPEDSGTHYMALPESVVTLSGGRRIDSAWKPSKNGGGIMMCEVGDLDFTQLFVNGKRQVRARYPKYDSYNPLVSGSGWVQAGSREGLQRDEFRFDPRTFTERRWAKPAEGVVHAIAHHEWGSVHFRIREVDWANHRIKLAEGGGQTNEIYQGPGWIGETSRFFVENIFEELDSPGEWYLDRESGTLYFLPPDDLDMDRALVEVPVLKHVIEFKGSAADPIRDLTISGFRIAHTASTYLEPYESPSLGDWSIHRDGAILVEGTEKCRIEKCFFDAVGGNGIFLNHYNDGFRVSDNTFTEAGDSAVCLVGKSHLRPGTGSVCSFCGHRHAWGWAEPSEEIPSECVITNNLIHDIGIFGKQVAGVFVALGMKMTISHNHIYNTPRAGICLNDGQWGGHVIEYNDIHDTVRETGDHGPFNSWGREPYWCASQSHGSASHPAGEVKKYARFTTIIRNNRFRDSHGWGIDLDDGSSNYHIYNNLCIGVSVKLREGDFRLIENNIFINPANPPGIHVGYENNSDRFVRNIVVTNTHEDRPEADVNFKAEKGQGAVLQFVFPPAAGSMVKEIDHNLYFNDIGQAFVDVIPRQGTGVVGVVNDVRRYDLEQWRALGFDRSSLFGDPRFVDPAKGDYRVRPQSPAIKLGFNNFPMDQFGRFK